MSDYERIAQAIEFIRGNTDRQPSLGEVASQVHLSEYHFQRLFSRWAGVTPKRYLQALTLERAKSLLRQRDRRTSLDASSALGLSSTSRLYDHFVQLDAVTPSEYRHRGQGLCIAYGYHTTPYGESFVAVTGRGICQLDFVDPANPTRPLAQLKSNWNRAEILEDPVQTGSVIARLFSHRQAPNTPISLWIRGTNFQINVWRALLRIQPGNVMSYSDIASVIGKPGAARAVGSAIGANPIALIIPCHRVLRQSGELGGYRWGELRKHAILAREAAGIE